jgi:hypothetical protein
MKSQLVIKVQNSLVCLCRKYVSELGVKLCNTKAPGICCQIFSRFERNKFKTVKYSRVQEIISSCIMYCHKVYIYKKSLHKENTTFILKQFSVVLFIHKIRARKSLVQDVYMGPLNISAS